MQHRLRWFLGLTLLGQMACVGDTLESMPLVCPSASTQTPDNPIDPSGLADDDSQVVRIDWVLVNERETNFKSTYSPNPRWGIEKDVR